MNRINYSLYLVTDAGLAGDRSIFEIVDQAIRSGVDVVQYREKNKSTRELIEEARTLHEICRRFHIPFIVNDRVDVALAVDAEGVHVGQDDMPAQTARRIIGSNKILGVSIGNIVEMEQAVKDGADYVGASPIFSTPTKPDAPQPMGLEGLEAVCKVCPIPVVAIGGLNRNNAGDMVRAGAAGVAVVSAIVCAASVETAARELKRVIMEDKRTREKSNEPKKYR